MKRIFVKLMMIGIFFLLFMPTTTAEDTKSLLYPEYSKRISMDFQDANMKDVLKIFSQQSELNFIASDEVKDRTVTLFLDNVPVEEALDMLLVANNLTYEIEEGSNIFIVKELSENLQTITKIFFLKYASVSNSRLKTELIAGMERSEEFGAGGAESEGGEDAGGAEAEVSSIKNVIENVLSDIGVVIEDPRTNSLIVTDKAENFPMIEQTIAYLDIPTPQVLIEVEMLDVSKDLVDKMGVNWNASAASWLTYEGSSRESRFPIDRFIGVDPSLATEGFTMGTLSATGLDIALDLIATSTDTKYLARPRILTLSNETAEIKIVTDEAIGIRAITSGTEAAASTTSEAERAETGISLRVTPQVNIASGEITIFVEPTVSEAKTSALSSSYRDPERRQTKSLLRINDGETIVVGGLIRTRSTEIITKVPLLGDIPLLGALFRHKNKSQDEDRELMVFITPHIVEEKKLSSASKPMSSLPTLTREQDIPKAKKVEIEKALSKFENTSR